MTITQEIVEAIDRGETTLTRRLGIAYLTQCADRQGIHWYAGIAYPAADCLTCNGTNDAGHLRCFSRYGSRSADCAPVAWRLAYLIASQMGEAVTLDGLDAAMSDVVNESDSVAYIVREYGRGHYT